MENETTTQPPNAAPDATQNTQVSTDPLQAARDAANRQADAILADDQAVNPETAPAPTEPVQSPADPAASTQQVTPEATPPAPESSSEDDELYPTPPPAQVQGPQQIQAKDFIDANGYFDAEAFSKAVNDNLASVTQAASARAANEYQAQRNEERLWDKALADYPQLKTNKTLRQIVQNARIGEMTSRYQQAGAIQDPAQRDAALRSIKSPTPGEIAKSLQSIIGAAKQDGMIAATENIEVQQAVQAPTSSDVVEPTPNVNEQLFKKIGDPRDTLGAQKAQRDLLKNLLFGSQ